MKRLVPALLLGGFAPFAGAATCAVVGTPLAFGAYTSPGGAQLDTTSTLTVTCTPDYLLLTCRTDYTVKLSTGIAGGYAPRQLASGANRLDYNLYTSAARTTVWGDGTGGTSTVPGTINTSLLLLVCLAGNNNHTVYGRIPASQNVAAGLYSDTITVTVSY
mgnify:FL=1